jgi:thiosulfate/3-mercaptopyruvate sulfurtransferase
MTSIRAGRIFPFTAAVISLSAVLLILTVRAQVIKEPWTIAQTVQAADLQKELAGKNPPTVLFVGFQRLYNAGHIKGAQYRGTGANGEGLAGIKKWAEPLPRSINLVIYCGCCPMMHCPNVRPAFVELHEMGFTNLRVLILPSSFAEDWAEKGFPYDNGQ